MVKVKNMKSNRTNHSIANQFIIEMDGVRIFQSYDSIIARVTQNYTYLDKTFWNYSRTTSRYLSNFLNENTKTTKEKIEKGEYILTNLN